jgi:serine/threonine protein kinase
MEASTGSETVGYCKKVDLWSLGIILYVLICQEFPFGSDEEAGFVGRLLEGKLTFGKKWTGLCDGQCEDLVRKLICVDADKRLTVDQALQHPWIQKQRGLLDKIYRYGMVRCDIM